MKSLLILSSFCPICIVFTIVINKSNNLDYKYIYIYIYIYIYRRDYTLIRTLYNITLFNHLIKKIKI